MPEPRSVIDASAMVDLLLRNPVGEVVGQALAASRLHAPAHFDVEVLSAPSSTPGWSPPIEHSPELHPTGRVWSSPTRLHLLASGPPTDPGHLDRVGILEERARTTV